jgi:hypothetical protein
VQRGATTVPDRDDEVAAGEQVDLAGLDGVVGVDVPEGLEGEEQALVVPLELGPLVGLERVLDRERVQTERVRDVVELALAGLVEAHPDEVTLLGGLGPHLVELVREAVDLDALALAVERAVDDHMSTVVPVVFAAWQR